MGLMMLNLKNTIKTTPTVRSYMKSRYEKHFNSAPQTILFKGVYDTFDEAMAAAPANGKEGYNNTETANKFQAMFERVNPIDYPVLFWLKDIIDDSKCIFDFGGYTGVKYYAYHKYLRLTSSLIWTVCDLPEVITKGREIADSRNECILTFPINLLTRVKAIFYYVWVPSNISTKSWPKKS